jgi:cytochrome oxidase Cu insertion factor (SCO1/SenC/PrrC family)
MVSSLLVLLAATIWGTRALVIARQQASAQDTTTALANMAVAGFPLSGKFAPEITLTDQFGNPFTLSSLRGKEVVLAFIDSRCTSLCPLTAQIMADAKQSLGKTASQVVLLAVNANPTATSVNDVEAWSFRHNMLHAWYFVTGTANQLTAVYNAYQVGVYVKGTTVEHDPITFIIDAQGRERLTYDTLSSSSQADISSQEISLEAGMKQWLPQPQA